MTTRHKAVLYTDAHPPADHNHTAAGDGGALTAPELVNYIQTTNVAAPSTPASGKSRIFVRNSDKVLCTIDDAGTVRPYSTTSGTVTSVSGTSPIGVATGTTTPVVSISAATTGAAGSMSAADKTKLDGIAAGAQPGTVTSVTGTSPVASSGGTTPAISIAAATATAVGALKSPYLFTQTADVTVANTTSATTLLGAGTGTKTVGANEMTVGRSIRIRMCGYFEVNTQGDTIDMVVTVGGTLICTTTVANLTTTVNETLYWELDAVLTCRSTGAGGTYMGQMRLLTSAVNTEPGQQDTALQASSKTTAAVVAGTNSAAAVNVTAGWSVANTHNSMTCTNAQILLEG